jgi:TRAP-type mannitol/chloroaromatic compound transport system permease small subunit
MGALRGFVRGAERLNGAIGSVLSWATLGCVLICFSVAFLRYFAGLGYIWLQELYVWLHALVFLIGAGVTYQLGGHVRVDIFYRGASPRGRAWIDLIGVVVFLFPWLAVIFGASWRFFIASYAVGENSPQPGGMPGLWVLKGSLFIFCLLVGLQGLVVMARSVLVLKGDPAFATRLEGEGAEVAP